MNKSSQDKSLRITVSIKSSIKQAIDTLANDESRSLSNMINLLLMEALEMRKGKLL